MRVTWTARRSNQSILKEINPEYSVEGLMLKLKLQYFGHLMQRTHSFEKTLMLGKIEGEGDLQSDTQYTKISKFGRTYVSVQFSGSIMSDSL